MANIRTGVLLIPSPNCGLTISPIRFKQKISGKWEPIPQSEGESVVQYTPEYYELLDLLGIDNINTTPLRTTLSHPVFSQFVRVFNNCWTLNYKAKK